MKINQNKVIYSTGIKSLDDIIDIIKPGDLVFIGGAPAVGVGCLAAFIACINSIRHKTIVFNLGRNNNWFLNRTQYLEQNHNNIIFNDSAKNINDITNFIKTIDGCGLITCNFISAIQDCENVVFELKKLATELNIPIIATDVLNGDFEHRENSRPEISDIPKCIKEYADIIICTCRPEYYVNVRFSKNIESLDDDDFDLYTFLLNHTRGMFDLFIVKRFETWFSRLRLKWDMDKNKFYEWKDNENDK